jgi:hypothetical protein
MKSIFLLLTNTSFAKWIYGTVFGVSTYGLIQESQIHNTSFFEMLLQNVPAQIIYVLGIVYGVSLVLGKLSDSWTKHLLNKLKVKQEIQHLEQEEITTDKQRKQF